METSEIIIAGAGVVGLAIARELGLRGHEVLVVDKEDIIGSAVSSRDSEVNHLGIYYPPGSLKARFCVKGKKQLYKFCKESGVGHKGCAKLIVATTAEQVERLKSIEQNAAKNYVNDLKFLTEKETLELEPALACMGALYSPSTGIIDSHEFMLALQGGAETNNGMVVLQTAITGGEISGDKTIIDFGDFKMKCNYFINSAGLNAWNIARNLQGFPAKHIPAQGLAKGNYFSLSGRAPFSHLIYPVPEPGGLGVHLTLELAGEARFGPDVEWVDDLNFDVSLGRSESFYALIREYWPGLQDGSLQAAYSGIRPKISVEGETARDFLISRPEDHKCTGVINLFGIESPGLTSSMAIGSYIADMVEGVSPHPKR